MPNGSVPVPAHAHLSGAGPRPALRYPRKRRSGNSRTCPTCSAFLGFLGCLGFLGFQAQAQPLPVNLDLPSTSVTTGTVLDQAITSITAQNGFTIGTGASVTFTAGSSIDLKPGFHAATGSTFHAVIAQPVFTITITTAPVTGLSLTVDSQPCTSPCTFQSAYGANHTIAAATQTRAGTQYTFSNWSDNGAASHTISVAYATYTATFSAQPISVALIPSAATLYPSQQQQFWATVTGTSNTAVTWARTPNNAGAVDSTGLYTAPDTINGPGSVTVTATSVADTTKSASATVNLNSVPPPPSLTYSGPGYPYPDPAPFTFAVTDDGGSGLVNQVQILLWPNFWPHTQPPPEGLNACYLLYDRTANAFSILSDDASTWSQAYAPGSSNTISNSQCILDLSRTTVSAAGNTLTVSPMVLVKWSFGNNPSNEYWVYARAYDTFGQPSGYLAYDGDYYSVPGGSNFYLASWQSPYGASSTFSTSSANGSQSGGLYAYYCSPCNIVTYDPWITVTQTWGSSPESVAFSVADGPSRTGHIWVNGYPFTIIQGTGGPQPDFSLSVNPSSESIDVGSYGVFQISVSGTNGFSGQVNLSISGCATAPPGASLIPSYLVLSPANTVNNPKGSALVAPASTPAGAYCMNITGRAGFLIHNFSVYLNVGGSGLTVSPGAQNFNSSGGSGTFTVTTSGGWTATTPNSDWISLSSGSGNGSGTVGYSLGSNFGDPRTGTITVGGSSGTAVFMISQNSADPAPPPGLVVGKPTLVEVNLGPVPISLYPSSSLDHGPANGDYRTLPDGEVSPLALQQLLPGQPCPPGTGIRQCYLDALKNYASQQGVSGIRFIFHLCGGWWSQALNGCGLPPNMVFVNQDWLSRLSQFFRDVKASGIDRVIPAIDPSWAVGEQGAVPAWGYGTDMAYNNNSQALNTYARVQSDCDSNAPIYLDWHPGLPFGIAPGQKPPGVKSLGYDNDITGPYPGTSYVGGAGYNCSPANTVNFVGWENILKVIQGVLQTASNSGLTVSQMDLGAFGENGFQVYPVEARIIADNRYPDQTPYPECSGFPTDCPYSLLRHARDAMNSTPDPNRPGHFYDGSNFTYPVGITWQRTSPTDESTCLSPYGDAPQLIALSEMAAAIGGGGFGPITGQNGRCGGSITNVPGSDPLAPQSLAVSFSEPTILDYHASPCIEEDTTYYPPPADGGGPVWQWYSTHGGRTPAGGCANWFTPGGTPVNKDLGVTGLQAVPDTWAASESTLIFNALSSFRGTFCPNGWRGNSQELCNSLIAFGDMAIALPPSGADALYSSPPNPYDYAQDYFGANCGGTPASQPQGFVEALNGNSPEAPQQYQSNPLLGLRVPDGSPGVILRP